MATSKKILIAGFSGSGKTSLLAEIKRTSPYSDWQFHDLDQLVLKQKKIKDISTLVQNHGWDKFRLWERQEFEGWLKEEESGVLSLGGGTLNQTILDLYLPIKKIKFCHLHSPFEDCWERLNLEGTEERPLVRHGKAELQRLYEQRQLIFSQINWRIENFKGVDLKKLSLEFWDGILRS